MSFLLALPYFVLSFKTSGVQWWSREGDWEVFGEGLHRWQGQAEAKEAGLGEKSYIFSNNILVKTYISYIIPYVPYFSSNDISNKNFPQVGEGYALLGRDTGPGKDCVWYGTTFCDGDLVEDLFRWWFRMKCSKSKFTVASVPYTQVVQDPRFKS